MESNWYVNENTGGVFLLTEYQVTEWRREPGAARLTLISEAQALQAGSGATVATDPALDTDQDDQAAQGLAQGALEAEDETAEVSAEIVDQDEAQVAQQRRGRGARK
jgi:hypothetical protein